MYYLDTPGISKPNIRNMHVGMKLAVCNTLREEVIGQDIIRFCLFTWLCMRVWSWQSATLCGTRSSDRISSGSVYLFLFLFWHRRIGNIGVIKLKVKLLLSQRKFADFLLAKNSIRTGIWMFLEYFFYRPKYRFAKKFVFKCVFLLFWSMSSRRIIEK
jgi:hypothetical protein